MNSGLTLDYRLTEQPAKTTIEAWNTEVRGKTEAYVNFSNLLSYAELLRDRDVTDTVGWEFGVRSASKSYWKLSIVPEDLRGNCVVVVELATGDFERYRSEVIVRFLTDVVSIDDFANGLVRAIRGQEGVAHLCGKE